MLFRIKWIYTSSSSSFFKIFFHCIEGSLCLRVFFVFDLFYMGDIIQIQPL